MSSEERNYIIGQIDLFISLAREAQYQRMEGPSDQIEGYEAALEAQHLSVLSMVGIEF